MAEMTKKERIRAVLAGGSVDRTPASLWGHNFQREWTPRDLFEHTVEDYRSGDWDFIKFNPRSTYFAEAWGNAYERPTANQQPALRSAIVKSSTDLEDIFPVSPHEGVLGDHLFALRMLVDEVGDEVDILHTVFSPLSVTAQLCGTGTEFRDLAEANSAAAHGAVQSVCETLTEYAAAAVEMGASGVFFAHDNSNSGHSISNIKLVSWADVADETTPNLIIDTAWDPRGVGAPVPGDTDGNRIVNDLDYNNLVAQFGGAPAGINSADFNGDDVVNLKDFAIMRENFGFPSVAAPEIEPVATTPEPTCLTLMWIGVSGFLLRRSEKKLMHAD